MNDIKKKLNVNLQSYIQKVAHSSKEKGVLSKNKYLQEGMMCNRRKKREYVFKLDDYKSIIIDKVAQSILIRDIVKLI